MKKTISYITVFALFVMAMLLTACQPESNLPPNITLEGAIITSGNTTTYFNQTELNNTQGTTEETTSTGTNTGTTTEVTTTPETDTYQNVSKTITAVEGDLVKLDIKAVSPDGVPITYKYSDPFNKNGLWQTKDGDVGKYLVTITASDGKLSSSIDILVVINPSNKAPVIDCPEDVELKEGETVDLKCNFFDKENDALVIEYSGWMNSPTYTTNYESSGDHKVFVRVSDGYHNVTKTVNVKVENVDRAPIFNQHMKDMTVVESDIATLKPNVTDPDAGDKLKITYSDPFDKNGVWKTKIDDAGTYPITVVASDGTLTTKESFTLTVKMLNTAPVMKLIPNVTVDESETVKLSPDVVDREGDPIKITYSGWMTSSTYTTTYDDAYPKGCDSRGCSATYKVVVTASDGVYDVSQDVYVTVKDKNRAPVFVLP
jgi:hypothetical protein